MTPDLGTLRDLQSRVRAATGPSRELDARIWQAIVNGATKFTEGFGYSVQMAEEAGHPLAPRLTASIDEAVAFVERVLPGWAWTCGSCSDSYDAWLAPDRNGLDAVLLEIEDDLHFRQFDVGFLGDRRDGNPMLALLDAILQGLIAKAEHQAKRSSANDAMVAIGQVEGMP